VTSYTEMVYPPTDSHLFTTYPAGCSAWPGVGVLGARNSCWLQVWRHNLYTTKLSNWHW